MPFLPRWIAPALFALSCLPLSAASPVAKPAAKDPVFIKPAPRPLVNFAPAAGPPDLGVSREIWIGLRTDGLPGDGTLASPFNGSGTGLDGILRERFLAGESNLTVHLLPGTYLTEGPNLWNPRTGWSILGAGMDVTIVKRANSHARHFAVLGNDDYQEHITVSDMTVDSNYDPVAPTYANAVWLSGSSHTIRRVKAIHAYGEAGAEGFLLAINDAGRTSVGNLIEYCEISDFHGADCTALCFFGPATGSGTIKGIIRGNRVLNLRNGSRFTNLHAYGGGAANGVLIEGNYCINVDKAINGDTGRAKNLTVRGNFFFGIHHTGILLTGNYLEHIVIDGNVFEVDPTTATSISVGDSAGWARIQSLQIRNNTFHSMHGLSGNAGGLSMFVVNGDSVTISGNRIHAGLPSFFRNPGIRLFDNLDFDGRPINVRPGFEGSQVALPTGQAGTLLLDKGNAHLFAETSADPATNGLKLLTAYARARAMTPHGQPRSSANRVTLFLWPGKYLLADSALTLDAEYVDLVGLGAAGAVRLESAGNTVVQQASDAAIQNITLHCNSTTPLTFTANDKAAYFPADNLNRAALRNVTLSGNNNGLGMRLGITYSGYYENTVCGPRGWGGPGHFTGAALNCSAGDFSFGSGGFFAGAATNCTAGVGSFGAGGGGFHGVAKNCTAGHDSFGGSGQMIGCEVTGAVNAMVLTTGRLTNCRIGAAPGNQPALIVGAGATLQNCTLLANPSGSGYSVDAPASVRGRLSHCRFNHGLRNVLNDIAQPFNVDDPNID